MKSRNARSEHEWRWANRGKMGRSLSLLFICLFSFCCFSGAAAPYAGYMYPAGVESGKRSFVLIGGQNLNGIRSLESSCPALRLVSVEKVPYLYAAIPRDQRAYLEKWLERIRGGHSEPPSREGLDTDMWKNNAWWDNLGTLQERQLRIVESVLFGRRKNALQMNPSLSQGLLVEVEVESGVKPGCYEFRLCGNSGVSEPRKIHVDSVPRTGERGIRAPYQKDVPLPHVASFPAVLDGQILPGETDDFLLSLEKGKNYVFQLSGQFFQPFIGDAVPGHFQPVICLEDETNHEVALADDFRNSPDPVLEFRPSVSGVYRFRVRDNLFRGREDFVYEVKVWEGRYSENLPGMPDEWKEKCRETDFSGKRRFSEKDRSLAGRGVIKKMRQTDSFRVDVRDGETLVFETCASACGSSLDSVIRIKDGNGKVIAENDDFKPQWNIGSRMRWTDSFVQVKFPSKGTYTVEVFDRTGKGGDDYFYWLRMGPPQPFFQVYTAASSLVCGSKPVSLKFMVERKEGFAGDLVLSSPDVEFSGPAVISSSCNEGTFLISVPADKRKTGSRRVKIFVHAPGDGQNRIAVIPADECMQAFAYTHYLPAGDFYVTCPGGGKKGKQPQRKKVRQEEMFGPKGKTGRELPG